MPASRRRSSPFPGTTVGGAGGPARSSARSRTSRSATGGSGVQPTEYIGRGRNRKGGAVFSRRRRPDTIVRRIVFTGLLLLSLALVTVTYRGGDGPVIHGAQMAVLEVVAPIERGLSRAWDPVAGAWSWGGRLFHATSENPRLERENAELREQVAIAHAKQDELARLQRLLGMEERGQFPQGYDRVVGRVIVRSPTQTDRSVLIDLGTDDGVQKNDPVMVTGGLVGRVTEVSANTARVSLIINIEVAVSAVVNGRDAAGTLHPTSNEGSPVLRLAYVDQRADVRIDDEVVTSGWVDGDLRSLYPAGIPIGVVDSVGNSPGDIYKTIQVTPYANFDRIDEVMVLVPADGAERRSFVEPPLVSRDTSRTATDRRVDPLATRPATPRRAAGGSRSTRAGGGEG